MLFSYKTATTVSKHVLVGNKTGKIIKLVGIVAFVGSIIKEL